jgi:hypothetical protein
MKYSAQLFAAVSFAILTGCAPEVIAVMRELPGPSVRIRFPVLLRVQWGYDSLRNGMPTEQEIERGREIYSALVRLIGSAGIYAMSRTGDSWPVKSLTGCPSAR